MAINLRDQFVMALRDGLRFTPSPGTKLTSRLRLGTNEGACRSEHLEPAALWFRKVVCPLPSST